MYKKMLGVALVFQMLAGSAIAAELDEATRTVPLNDHGGKIVLSAKEIKEGKRLFNFACAQCHAGGMTKTRPDVGLGTAALSGATPNRNSIERIVDYLKNPTDYEGLVSINELHPSTSSADIFTTMRNLSDGDLKAIAGHILLQPKLGRWDN